MYELNLTRIDSQSTYLSTCLQVIQEIDRPTNEIERFALMRSFHIGVECVIDIGNTIIDGFIMRDPGGYSDIIDILEDEQVISAILANKLKTFVKLREQLVRYYDQVDDRSLEEHLGDVVVFQQFLEHIDAFLSREKANGNIYV
ncbi:DUF86 domain-containing protein [Shimazuella kribbensis]|uniref:DUF86 domain-containing protein n=1 Tax=Shimazuella kribbensis TaxID=139808 RepID=UPI00041957B4|nr:DUF86 domain-containing protein [Shimazuella kribbensis]